MRGVGFTMLDSPGPLRVAIELAFSNKMNPREHSSLAAQLVRVYGLNNKRASPLSLHLTALNAARANAPNCLPPPDHMCAWEETGQISLHEQPAGDVWPAETVWLSPDADELLTAPLSNEVVYVLSGLVDRTVAKGASLERARESGAKAVYRLPVREHAPRTDVHPIFSLPTCTQVLADVHGGSSWEEAFAAAVPKRYLHRREREEAWRASNRDGRRE
jgi:hypothetical protein